MVNSLEGVSAWEKKFLKNWPSFPLTDWTKKTNEQRLGKHRNLDNLVEKRFENVFVEIDQKVALGSGRQYFKTAVAVTKFGLAFVNTGPALIFGKAGTIGEMLFWSKKSFEKYKQWNVNHVFWELKQDIVSFEIKEILGASCIVIDYLFYSLFSFPFGKGAKKTCYLFLEDYQGLFKVLKKKIN